MTKYCVTVLDTTGIQSYIFVSNRLRENIGASYLVAQSTDGWVKDKLEELGVSKDKQKEPITSSSLKAELVYAGGGNTVIIFKSIDDAKEFTKKLSLQILKQAPGIKLVVAHKEFTWDQCLKDIVQELINNEIEQQKRANTVSVPLLGLGVTAACQSTQLVAVNTSKEYVNVYEQDKTYLISRETKAKLIVTSSKYSNKANNDLRQKFQDILKPKGLEFPYRMDHLGRSEGESSYYAVVHADGNNMGELFRQCGERGCEQNPQDPNRGYIDAMRELSNNVNQAGLKAMKKVINTLVKSIKDGQVINKKNEAVFSIRDKFLPLRPLVYGGDDITFVCDGRLGLELATLYLKAFEQETRNIPDRENLTACAGVCIVKSHYPFARAYTLSEQLCSSAKKFVREQNNQFENEYSAIDWHIATSGLLGTIGEIRQREYKVNEGDLTMRPLLIKYDDNQWRNWSNFTDIVNCLNGIEDTKESKQWKGRRNKIITLREKLRDGKEATEKFCQASQIKSLPTIKGSCDIDALQTGGWTENICGYFDAIEAMEFYVPLLDQGGSDDNL